MRASLEQTCNYISDVTLKVTKRIYSLLGFSQPDKVFEAVEKEDEGEEKNIFFHTRVCLFRKT